MDLTNYLPYQKIVDRSSQIKRVFFYRVCGTGMGACATLLREQGYEVEGGDNRFAPPMSDYLRATGIILHDLAEFDARLLKGFDLIVVGNVVPKDSADSKLIEESGVPFASFPATLGALVLNKQNVVGIAGTHGKTTTTYLAAQIFEGLGIKAGYFVGGVIPGKNSAQLGEGKYFFIESDEYDSGYFEKFSKFRSYCLDHMILTSLEFDHGDIFNHISEIQAQFQPVIENLPGKLIFDETYSAATELINQSGLKASKVRRYGKETGPEIIEMSSEGTVFRLFYGNQIRTFKTNLVGKHNILNLSSCLIFCDEEGFSFEKVSEVIIDLHMVKRRQEVKGHLGSALVIDDFAHHPRAVELTLEGIKVKYPKHKITVVFEPNSATARSDLFQKEFTAAFSTADRLVVTKPVRDTSLKNAKNLDLEKMKSDLAIHQVKTLIAKDLNELMEALKDSQKKDDLILILSNGTCLGFWESDFVK